jgi:N-methylhydantoinase A
VSKYALAIDIGGTFTDAVLTCDDGRNWTDKTLTTPRDLLEGFFRGAQLVLNRAGIGLEDLNDVVTHATTVVTNALIERKGGTTALLVTKGFRDVLYIRDEHRYDMFDPQIEYSEPLVKREHTYGIDERTYADGTVGLGIDEVQIRDIGRQLRSAKVSAVAICLLNSYLNPENERRVQLLLSEVVPEIFI